MRPLIFLFVACLTIFGCPSLTKPSGVESEVLCVPATSGNAVSDAVDAGVDSYSSASASASSCDLKMSP